MKTGYPGGWGWCRATSKSRTPSAKFTESTSSSVGGRESEVCEQKQDGERREAPAHAIRRAEPQRFVQAAETIAAQIDGDVLVAERPQLAIDRVGDVGLERPGNLVTSELDPGDRVVMADPEHTEPEIAARLRPARSSAASRR